MDKKPALKKYLFWPAAIGIVCGAVSIAVLYFNVPVSPAIKFCVWLPTIVVLTPFIAITQPFLHWEGKSTMLYVLASPAVFSMAGLLLGYTIYGAHIFWKKKFEK